MKKDIILKGVSCSKIFILLALVIGFCFQYVNMLQTIKYKTNELQKHGLCQQKQILDETFYQQIQHVSVKEMLALNAERLKKVITIEEMFLKDASSMTKATEATVHCAQNILKQLENFHNLASEKTHLQEDIIQSRKYIEILQARLEKETERLQRTHEHLEAEKSILQYKENLLLSVE